VNLDIHRGDYFAIVGGNGSGKTTLVRIILGLIQPAHGDVRLFGTPIAEFKDWQKIGYVRQHATNIDTRFPATVFEVAMMGRYASRGLLRRTTDEDRAKAEEALREAGIWELKDRYLAELSGGQLQRVFIARALAGEPEVLFLDEPTVGVDAEARENFYELLRTLNEQKHLTVVLVTHDVESVASRAMHIVCVDCRVFFHRSYDEYLKSVHTDVRHIRAPHHHA
jgi:zinc transport system ATP-binding protein